MGTLWFTCASTALYPLRTRRPLCKAGKSNSRRLAVCLRKRFLRGGRMLFRTVLALVVLVPFSRFAVPPGGVPSSAAGEYSKHFGALSTLSIAVAEAMPSDQYGFRPHPESMNFGELMAH